MIARPGRSGATLGLGSRSRVGSPSGEKRFLQEMSSKEARVAERAQTRAAVQAVRDGGASGGGKEKGFHSTPKKKAAVRSKGGAKARAKAKPGVRARK